MVLGIEQQEAINNITSFLDSSNTIFSLTGYAGTGKSFLIKELIKILYNKRIDFVLSAPTHKAKVVLERFAGREAMTIHKLLSLSPNIEILDLDFKDLKFLINNFTSSFPYDGVVICDESSMISDDLYELLEEKCKQHNSKIIFVGDKAQLRPVNSLTHSRVFNNPNSYTLTKIYRQSDKNGLNAYLPDLREKVVGKFYDSIGEEGSLYCVNNVEDLFKKGLPYFKKAISNKDILETKFLAYTNARVASYNKKAKQILFQNDKEFNKFEFLTGYENLEFNRTKFWNSMDYIIVEDPVKVDISVFNFIKLPGYKLTLYDESSDCVEDVCILSKEISQDYLTSLAAFIEVTRLEAIELKQQRRSRDSSRKWQDYYRIIGSFTTPYDLYYDNRLIRKKSFDHGYATTVHKAQGSSINNVLIDMSNIFLCKDQDELRQLQYVALSRAKTNVYILQ